MWKTLPRERRNRTTNLLSLQQRIRELENAEEVTLEELQNTMEELRVAEAELRQQQDELTETRQQVEMERERYAALFNLAPDGYLVTDAAGIIQEANHAAVTLLAASQEVLVGKPLVLWIAKEDRLAFHTQLAHLTQALRVHDWNCGCNPSRACFPHQHYGWCVPEPPGTSALAVLAPA